MSENSRLVSIKNLFVWFVMIVTSLGLLVSSGISLWTQLNNYTQELTEEVYVFAELIGLNASIDITTGDNILLESNLRSLTVAEFIENVHIYRLNEDDELEFFASYNQAGHAPVSSMIHRVNELEQPQLHDGIVEVIRPINKDDQVIGFTYIRISASRLTNLTTVSILITSSVLIIMLSLCYVLTLKLQKRVSDPIEELIQLVQKIARQKDYSVRAKRTRIRELDLLSDAFNVMISRIQDHVTAQAEAESEHKRLNESLEEKVQQRTNALKEANQELIQTLEKLHQFQRQMVQNEKMASLGDMVAGVAHEVNTPIGLGVTASTMMLDKLTHIQKEFDDKKLKASVLSKFLSESNENLNIIYRNLNRAAELISSFKQVAVDQSSEASRVFGFAQLMREILLSMRPKLKSVEHEILVHCDEDLFIESIASPIHQIMINLIMNSIIHGFESIEKGQIDIHIDMASANKIRIVYKDNGRGIPDQIRKKIFDPFVTTKRGQGGSGLGMHLVYNLVTSALDGSISLSSEEGKGVEFHIVFPARKADAIQ